MTWNRKLWGVEFRGRLKEDKPMLLGQAWHRVEMAKPTYEGEPTRALLFTTREACRNWCRERQDAHSDLGWKFIPVKVRELVEKVPNAEITGRTLAQNEADGA
ncbi:MAG: hypothetical protein WC710_15225 [Gallionella sp.]